MTQTLAKNIRLVGLTVLTLFVLSALAASRDPAEYFFHLSFGDLKEELETVRSEQKKGLLVMFETEDCPWCRKMKVTILNQPSVQDYYRDHFRILSLDAEGDTTIVDFDGNEVIQREFALKHNRIRATPVFAFFDRDGKLVTRHTGIVRDVDEFLWLGEFVVDGHYKHKRFTIYKRERRAAQKSSS